MDLNKFTKQAKRIVDQRGGMESLKQDANELKEIAGKPGSLREKAKAAAAALKDPRAKGGEPTAGPHPPGEPEAAPAPPETMPPPHEAAPSPPEAVPGPREAVPGPPDQPS